MWLIREFLVIKSSFTVIANKNSDFASILSIVSDFLFIEIISREKLREK